MVRYFDGHGNDVTDEVEHMKQQIIDLQKAKMSLEKQFANMQIPKIVGREITNPADIPRDSTNNTPVSKKKVR